MYYFQTIFPFPFFLQKYDGNLNQFTSIWKQDLKKVEFIMRGNIDRVISILKEYGMEVISSTSSVRIKKNEN